MQQAHNGRQAPAEPRKQARKPTTPGLPVAPENGSVQRQNAVAIDRQRVAVRVDEVRNHLLSTQPEAAKPEQLTVSQIMWWEVDKLNNERTQNGQALEVCASKLWEGHWLNNASKRGT